MAFRLTQKDRENIVGYIKEELSRREKSKFRKIAEENWARIDRQIAMEEPMVIVQNEAKEDSNRIQPGHLADSIEINVNDALRLAFPQDRRWFVTHLELENQDPKTQKMADSIYRSFLAQQHKDFSLKDRTKLLVNEAFAHGSFVGEIRWDTMMMWPDGRKTKTLSAPVIQPFSMWNCYPEPAPELIGTDLFYRGSMIIKSEIRREVALRNPLWRYKGDQKDKRNMLDVIYYYGMVVIPRSRGDEYIPNRKVVIVDDELVYSQVNDLDYPSIIYGGYERTDVRNPYYMSPIIKRGPSMAAATIALNNFLDAADIKNFPPTIEDSLVDQEIDLTPRARNRVQGGINAVSVIDIGNPEAALAAYQVLIEHVERGVGDERRAGVAPSTDLTATGELRLEQRAEVRISEFVNVLERQALLPYLYMQHELNKKMLKDKAYPFFNDELNSPDFMRMSSSDIPKNAVFEVTGSKTVLGELTRSQKFRETAAFVLSNERTAQRSNVEAILEQAWQDSGVKDPQRFMIPEQEDQNPQIQQAVAQVQQQAQQEIENLRNQLAQAQGGVQVQTLRAQAEIQLKAQKQQLESQLEQNEDQRKQEESQAAIERENAKIDAQIRREDALAQAKQALLERQAVLDQEKMQREEARSVAQAEQTRQTEQAKIAREEEEKSKQKEPAQVINIMSAQGGKKVTVDTDSSGRIQGATVQPIEE